MLGHRPQTPTVETQVNRAWRFSRSARRVSKTMAWSATTSFHRSLLGRRGMFSYDHLKVNRIELVIGVGDFWGSLKSGDATKASLPEHIEPYGMRRCLNFSYCYATQSRRCARAQARSCGCCMCICICISICNCIGCCCGKGTAPAPKQLFKRHVFGARVHVRVVP